MKRHLSLVVKYPLTLHRRLHRLTFPRSKQYVFLSIHFRPIIFFTIDIHQVVKVVKVVKTNQERTPRRAVKLIRCIVVNGVRGRNDEPVPFPRGKLIAESTWVSRKRRSRTCASGRNKATRRRDVHLVTDFARIPPLFT